MRSSLTLRDLLLPGEPLDPGEVLAGEGRLGNGVTWVVSLRPYPPALPRLRGGELALVSIDFLARIEPPLSLGSVIRQLAAREASGVVVRGEVDGEAIEVARTLSLPLIQLQGSTPLHDIEQAVMRECALYQARREMFLAEAPAAWVDDLLAGRIASTAEAQIIARRHGYTLASHYAVAHISSRQPSEHAALPAALAQIESDLRRFGRGPGVAAPQVVAHLRGDGLLVLLPQGSEEALKQVASWDGLCCGISRVLPLASLAEALSEALLAASASRQIKAGDIARYGDLGADRLLLILQRDQPKALAAFVEETLGPLLRHDARAASPLLPTVRAFVEHGGRLRETAAGLYVHRNTLAYRLDRAAEILGTDLKDPDARLAVELALRALPLLNSGR